MRFKILLLLSAFLMITVQLYAQNGITIYELNKKTGSWPNYLLAHNNVLYFSAVDSSRNCLWAMDGKDKPLKIFKPQSQDLYPTVVAGKGDSLYVLIYGGNELTGLHIYNTSTRNMTIVQRYATSRGVIMTDSSHIYTFMNEPTNGGWNIYRYNIFTGKDRLFLKTGKHRPRAMVHAHNNYYVSAAITVDENVYATDTATQSLSHLLVPDSDNKTLGQLKMNKIGDDIYFMTSTPQYNYEIYRQSVGNREAERLTDLMTTVYGEQMAGTEIVAYNKKLYFLGSEYRAPLALFSYDLTLGMTEVVYEYDWRGYLHFFFEPTDLFVYKSRLYMSAIDSTAQPQFFTYNGIDTPRMIAQIQFRTHPQAQKVKKHFTICHGDLYFVGADTTNDAELYRYNDSLPDILEEEVVKQIPVVAYPNPTDYEAYLHVLLEKPETIYIALTNTDGKDVYKGPRKEYAAGKHIITVPTEQLLDGVYVYHLHNETGRILASGRITKQ